MNSAGRVEVYALRDILLNEELGSDYDAPFWVQRHNGLSTFAQAQQVQAYYQQHRLPWYSAKSSPTGPPSHLANTPTISSIPPDEPGSQLAYSEPTTTPPTESSSTSPSTSNSPDRGEPPNRHPHSQPTHVDYVDLTSTPDSAPTAPVPTPAVQPTSPPPLHLGTNNEITQQILDERRTIDRIYGLDCSIQSTRNLSNEHRLMHPQLYRLSSGGLLTGDIIHAILDIQNNMRPNVCFKHMVLIFSFIITELATRVLIFSFIITELATRGFIAS